MSCFDSLPWVIQLVAQAWAYFVLFGIACTIGVVIVALWAKWRGKI